MSPLVKNDPHTVIVELSVKEFQDGAEVNATSTRLVGDQDYTELVMRILKALVPAPRSTTPEDRKDEK